MRFPNPLHYIEIIKLRKRLKSVKAQYSQVNELPLSVQVQGSGSLHLLRTALQTLLSGVISSVMVASAAYIYRDELRDFFQADENEVSR